MRIDIHAHVLPGVDDGAKDWKMCLEMLAQSAACGIERVIATPHFLPWRKNVHPDTIRELCEKAKEKLEKEKGIAIDIYPGNEIYYSIGVSERIKKGEALTLADSQYVLLEFKTSASYQELCRAVREMRDNGYVPIIAHMERYQCLGQAERINELKEMGALFQMNLDSLQGGIFSSRAGKSKKLISHGVIDFLATDMHDLETRTPMRKEDLAWIQKKIDFTYREELLGGKAQQIFAEIKR